MKLIILSAAISSIVSLIIVNREEITDWIGDLLNKD